MPLNDDAAEETSPISHSLHTQTVAPCCDILSVSANPVWPTIPLVFSDRNSDRSDETITFSKGCLRLL